MCRLLAFIAVALLLASCSKKNPAQPVLPPPTLEGIWPSTEGLLWTYSSVKRGWGTPLLLALYDNPLLVPPVTFDTVAAVLATRPAGANRNA